MRDTAEDYLDIIQVCLDGRPLTPSEKADPVCGHIEEYVERTDVASRYLGDPLGREVAQEAILAFVEMLLRFLADEKKEKERQLEAIESAPDAELFDLLEQLPGGNAHGMNIPGMRMLLKGRPQAAQDIANVARVDGARAVEFHYRKRRSDFAHRLIDRLVHPEGTPGPESGTSPAVADELLLSTWRATASRMPLIRRIAALMGRQQESKREFEEVPVSHYRPQLVLPTASCGEINGVTYGSDIARTLPGEMALMADGEADSLFYQRFATAKLQLFSLHSPEKSVQPHNHTERHPRPDHGPIIVGVDTSGSMQGVPEQMAKAMALQLAETARETGRDCYLILWSVRARAIALTGPGSWATLRQFLQEKFSGGTDPTDFFEETFRVLDSDDFGRADVLMISDFQVPEPSAAIADQIKACQDDGTRFYGLVAGRGFIDERIPYQNILNRIWHQSAVYTNGHAI